MFYAEMNHLDEIDRVFRMEIETLARVRENLDDSYAKALELLLRCTGKVVVSGTGKSGIIAHKIASTLSSTGTPALFLYPGSGMHGDVGILQTGDLLLAISKSGETEELMSMLLYVKKLSVPVICITTVRESSLGKNSDQVLWTPVDEEACPLNLAPTSSTTAALVVGDALAMALMKARGLQPEQFALFHPGGQLGRRLLMTVESIMRSGESNPTVNANDTVRQMLSEITRKRCGAVSVVDDNGELVGLVTDYDIRQTLDGSKDIFSMAIPDIMMSKPTYIFSDEMAVNALDIMENREKPFMVLPVLDRETKKVVAMVHVHDLVAKGL